MVRRRLPRRRHGAKRLGKSTLLTIAGSLETPTSGDVLIDGKALSRMWRNDKARLRRRSVAYVGVIGLLRGNAHDGGIAALGNIPVADLLPVLVGIPALTAAVGWLFGGREAPAVAHQPIE